MLNHIVDAYLSFAEIQAKSEYDMTMRDWICKLDEYLTLLGKGVLRNAGKVCTKEAEKMVNQEYKTYKRKRDKNYISDFDREVRKLLDNKKNKFLNNMFCPRPGIGN